MDFGMRVFFAILLMTGSALAQEHEWFPPNSLTGIDPIITGYMERISGPLPKIQGFNFENSWQ